MEAVKNVLLENINSAKNSLKYDLTLVNNKINQLEGNIKKLARRKTRISQNYKKI